MSHRHEHHRDSGCTDIGSGVCLRPTVHGGDPDVTGPDGLIAGGPDEHLAGFIVAYDWPGEDTRLEGAVTVDPHIEERARWSMTGSLEGGDLTLSPSIQAYHRDGHSPTIHGFVQNGKWVPA